MMHFLDRYQEQGYALLRITTSFMFMLHGSQKLLGIPPAVREMPWHIQYVAGSIQLFCGFLILVGLLTRPAAFLSSGLMAAAYWTALFSVEKWLPIMNRGDAAVMYCFIFLYIACKGSGIWSVEGRK